MKVVYLITLTVSLTWINFSHGACATPTGSAGQLQYISGTLKFCDIADTWRDVNGTSTGVSCAGETGKITYRTGQIQYCNGTNWIQTSNTIDHGSCVGTTAGYYYYSSTGSGVYYSNLTYYWYCNGSNWRRMGTGTN